MIAGRLRGIRHAAFNSVRRLAMECSVVHGVHGTVWNARNGGKCVAPLSTVNNALRVQTSPHAHHQIVIVVLIETTL